MASVRVYVPTYKRNELFVRAINSLLAQTFTNWIAEIHNDCPDDNFPEIFIKSLNDERFLIYSKNENLGAIKIFNLFFNNDIKETFYCLLEDDNWWEPIFLESMIMAMEDNIGAIIAFANHYIWDERVGNKWIKRNETRYSQFNSIKYEWVKFRSLKNICDYSFSNCSLFIRANKFDNFEIPLQTRGDFMEHVRQRVFVHPLLFISKPLVNFSLTLDSYRKKSLKGYHEHEAMLIASFFKYCNDKEKFGESLISELRNGFGNSINRAIYAGIIDTDSRFLLTKINIKEWILFLLYCLKHLGNTINVFQTKKKYEDLWNYLCVNTKNRFEEEC